VPNQAGILLPGTYAQVDLTTPRKDPPLVIPGDTLGRRPDGTQVALSPPTRPSTSSTSSRPRLRGDRIEVISGLQQGTVVVNPGDVVREGAKVKPALLNEKPAVSNTPPAGPSR